MNLVTARGRCRVRWGLTLIVIIWVLALSRVSASDFSFGFILRIMLLGLTRVTVVTWCMAPGLTMKPRLSCPAGRRLSLWVRLWTRVGFSSVTRMS